ncbi:MAG: hypothetical protein HY719_16540 [Planctomycetes bacterium]|nr:hypothetical protein [Planctomycetota bacterium]
MSAGPLLSNRLDVVSTTSRLLRSPEALLAALDGPWPRALPVVLTLLALSGGGGVAYGAAVGLYSGADQAGITGGKIPVLFFGTLAIAGAAMLVFAVALRTGLTLQRIASVCLLSIAVTNVILGAWSPVVAVFSLSLKFRDPTSYGALVLLATASVGSAAFFSVWWLRRGLAGVGVPASRSRRLLAMWLALYGFTGLQVTWLLRPYVGRSADRMVFEGNFFEAVFIHLSTLFGAGAAP